jgi:Ca-activated chloride channel family protein
MEQIRSNGEQKELRDEIVDLGTRYGIVTPYTSYLALEPNAQPQNLTPGGRFGLGGLRRALPAAPPPSAKTADASAATGLAGVQQSKRAREQQETATLEKDTPSSAVRRVGEKTFYLREGVWVDSEFKPDGKLPETAVKFGSDEYFDLIKRKSRLGEFFALGEQVIVVFEGRVYRVTSATS